MSEKTTIRYPMGEELMEDGKPNPLLPCVEITFDNKSDLITQINGNVERYTGGSLPGMENIEQFVDKDATRVSILDGQFEVILLDIENVKDAYAQAGLLLHVVRLFDSHLVQRSQVIMNKQVCDYACIALYVTDAGMLKG